MKKLRNLLFAILLMLIPASCSMIPGYQGVGIATDYYCQTPAALRNIGETVVLQSGQKHHVRIDCYADGVLTNARGQ